MNLGLLLLLSLFINSSLGNYELNVEHKFGVRGSERTTLSALRAHDERRHGRRLSAIDIPLGGDGLPTGTGLYYTKIGLGSPSKDYYVQVDTGSDLMWVNCAGCDTCPKKSGLHLPLRLYDRKNSKTGELLTCDEEFCSEVVNPSSCKVGDLCTYKVTYGDGSSSGGYFVTDTIQLNKASANLQTTPMNGSIIFGCGASQEGQLGSSDQAVDGIIGFGRSNSSVLSQLSSDGKVKKIFSHCLNPKNGGGIFAIGELVRPKVNSTPFVPNLPHYNVMMIGVEVNQKPLQLSSGDFGDKSSKEMVLDSGSTLAYLEQDLYKPLVSKILAAKPGLKLHTVQEQYTCFNFSGNVDDTFPAVTFRFEDSLSLTVYPHEYLFEDDDNDWCVGWQNGGVQTNNGKALNLLGDMVLGNK